MTDTDWRTRAACLHADPEVFFPAPKDRHTLRTAVALCEQCPVITDCRAFADKIKPGYGIWAGKPRITKENSYTSPAKNKVCGSPGDAGAQRHRRRHEPVCTPCAQAAILYRATLT